VEKKFVKKSILDFLKKKNQRSESWNQRKKTYADRV
jgi:hypothetical protein